MKKNKNHLIIWIKNINFKINKILFSSVNLTGEEEFYESIKNKLSYDKLTKRGIKKREFFKEYKNKYELDLIQKETLIGIMLGDGYLNKCNVKYPRLEIEQSYPIKKEYLMALFEIFKPLVVSYPKIRVRKPDKRTGKVYKSIRFVTSSFKCLNEYHDIFYKNGKKAVPKNIEELLTVRALAYWIMDDGGRSDRGQVTLHTRCFTKEEVLLLQDSLKIKFNLKSRIKEQVKNQWIIFIQTKQEVNVKELVRPYMHRSMLYKII